MHLSISTTHFRSKVRSDAQDVTIEDNANSEYAGKANLLVEFGFYSQSWHEA